MLKEQSVNLGNLILSLSDAVDLASPAIATHQVRTAFIAWQLAVSAGLPDDTVEWIFLTALLHDIGALSQESKIRLHNFTETDLSTHCIIGESLFRKCPLLAPAAGIVRHHHRPWQEWDCSLGDPDVLESQIIYLADLLERYVERDRFVLHQVEGLTKKIVATSGTELHPDVVDLYLVIAKREDFWLDLTSARLYSLLLNHGPNRQLDVGINGILSIGRIFREIIDFRSRFTATHSTGVAECAVMLGRIFGLTDLEVLNLKLAGQFHDLGKLVVPNAILEKPGRLTSGEFAIVKQHTYWSYSVLNSIDGLGRIAEWAAFHHEKLDGNGYPFRINADRISTGSRIMAVADIFTALTEDRPYRLGMDRKNIERILTDNAENSAIDKRIVGLLLENFADISEQVREKQAVTEDYYQRELVDIGAA
ncbi:MAG: HD domain-containing protein [Desulfobacterales bacterium]|nr:HD domain-containing protein [Desulfobacterales bacterium]